MANLAQRADEDVIWNWVVVHAGRMEDSPAFGTFHHLSRLMAVETVPVVGTFILQTTYPTILTPHTIYSSVPIPRMDKGLQHYLHYDILSF